MSIENELAARSGSSCELCGAGSELQAYQVTPSATGTAADYVHICTTCFEQIEDSENTDAHHWRCLNDSMWSEVPAVKVVSWRMLNKLSTEGWAQDLLGMFYMDEETKAWAEATTDHETTEAVVHVDSNGVVLEAGDSVVLIKDLNVKGANFIAKRGTAVRRISLVQDNPEHIEGRVNDQHIVILTKFVKKLK
ncbi:MAG: PhnA domain-containing protein [Saprospiraceae bacterium]|nr:PhnA domain-containing protein [Saprospiraceae bacterium]